MNLHILSRSGCDVIGSKAFRTLMGGLAKGLPAIASTSLLLAYIGMPEDLSGRAWKKPNTFYLILILTWHRMIPSEGCR